jgi:hypothetical protein
MEVPVGHAGDLIHFAKRLLLMVSEMSQRVSHARYARSTHFTPLSDAFQTCLVTFGYATHDQLLFSLFP